MSNKVKTYVVNGINTNLTLLPSDLADYQGCFYYLSGPGGNGGSLDSITNLLAFGTTMNINYGGSAGYVNSGYINFEAPYGASGLTLTTTTSDTSLSIKLTGDPTNGTQPIVINVDKGNVYENSNVFGEDYTNYSGPRRFTTKDVNSEGLNYFGNGYYTGDLELINSNINSFTYDQRNNLYYGATGGTTGYASSGNICSLYGNLTNSVFGGAGFYGNNGNVSDSYGYSSGYNSTSNYGYGIISLIPEDFILQSYFITGNTGITGPSDMILYNLVGGGGGGGGASDYDDKDSRGGGGGGAGDMIFGFLNTNNQVNIQVGSGGTGTPDGNLGRNVNGQNGGNTVLNNITSYGGMGGGYNSITPYPGVNVSGAGGPGYYGGGGGVGGYDGDRNIIYSYGGATYTNIFSYYGGNGYSQAGNNPNIPGNGAGAVSGYGEGGNGGYDIEDRKESGGGGGGGFWGGTGSYCLSGSITSYGTDGSGYGCGGGGGSQYINGDNPGGRNGSPGYAIVHYINTSHPYIKVLKITKNTNFSSVYLTNFKGFWFFLSGNGATSPFGGGKSYHNTGHFLIKEDGVSNISITKSINSGSSYFNIQVNFNFTIMNTPQIFNLKANSPQSYMMIMFYA